MAILMAEKIPEFPYNAELDKSIKEKSDIAKKDYPKFYEIFSKLITNEESIYLKKRAEYEFNQRVQKIGLVKPKKCK